MLLLSMFERMALARGRHEIAATRLATLHSVISRLHNRNEIHAAPSTGLKVFQSILRTSVTQIMSRGSRLVGRLGIFVR